MFTFTINTRISYYTLALLLYTLFVYFDNFISIHVLEQYATFKTILWNKTTKHKKELDCHCITDDELANLPTILPDISPRMGKSVSLPVMDESQESRLERTSQWAQSQFSFGHPFSDTDMSPMARLERVFPHEP